MVNNILSKYVEFSSSSGSSCSTASIWFSATSGSLDEAFPDGHILPTSNLKNSSFAEPKYATRNFRPAFPNWLNLPTSNLKIFSFTELKYATRNFRHDLVFREGRFGRFFKGYILDEDTYDLLSPSNIGTGMAIAVHELKPLSLQEFEEWQSEVNLLGRISHPNLLKLLGYCLEDRELLLVYECMQKRSWDDFLRNDPLFGRESFIRSPPWHIRLKVAIGAARGLDFLHSLETPVIYGDFRASNILLDEFYNPTLSDFGFLKMGPLMYEYVASEYFAPGHLDVKSDVYGFGVVLFRTLTGKLMEDWTTQFLANRTMLNGVMDARLEGQYPAEGAFQAAVLTLKCLEQKPQNRPSMKEVVQILEQIETIKDKPEVASQIQL